jgi:hypothetical protein
MILNSCFMKDEWDILKLILKEGGLEIYKSGRAHA